MTLYRIHPEQLIYASNLLSALRLILICSFKAVLCADTEFLVRSVSFPPFPPRIPVSSSKNINSYLIPRTDPSTFVHENSEHAHRHQPFFSLPTLTPILMIVKQRRRVQRKYVFSSQSSHKIRPSNVRRKPVFGYRTQ